jgi:hypothetical protein
MADIKIKEGQGVIIELWDDAGHVWVAQFPQALWNQEAKPPHRAMRARLERKTPGNTWVPGPPQNLHHP